MAAFSFEDGWVFLQRCLERIREGADAPLVPVVGSGLHLWAGVSDKSPIASWNVLLQQVSQRLKLDDFPREALKDFPTLAWDSMMVAAARNGGQAAHRVETTARKLVHRIITEDAAERITPEMQDRYRNFAELPWQNVISLNFDALWAEYGLGGSVELLPRSCLLYTSRCV